ncbi:MAG: hypothetical protein JWQ35_1468 [Bacteriovoracaceae bacterium]|nr:hypothetical protein [Bacteriovoracaceae bacterium]
MKRNVVLASFVLTAILQADPSIAQASEELTKIDDLDFLKSLPSGNLAAHIKGMSGAEKAEFLRTPPFASAEGAYFLFKDKKGYAHVIPSRVVYPKIVSALNAPSSQFIVFDSPDRVLILTDLDQNPRVSIYLSGDEIVYLITQGTDGNIRKVIPLNSLEYDLDLIKKMLTLQTTRKKKVESLNQLKSAIETNIFAQITRFEDARDVTAEYNEILERKVLIRTRDLGAVDESTGNYLINQSTFPGGNSDVVIKNYRHHIADSKKSASGPQLEDETTYTSVLLKDIPLMNTDIVRIDVVLANGKTQSIKVVKPNFIPAGEVKNYFEVLP